MITGACIDNILSERGLACQSNRSEEWFKCLQISISDKSLTKELSQS